MATLDPFLRAVVQNQADALVLRPGQLPALRRGEQDREIAKTQLDGVRIQRLLLEIGPQGGVPVAGAGTSHSFDYVCEGTRFRVELAGTADGWTAVATPVTEAAGSEPGAPVAVPAPERRRARTIDELLLRLVDQRGSDLHLAAGQAVRLRIDGEMLELADLAAPASEEIEALLAPVLPARNARELGEDNDSDFAYEIPGQARFRVNVYRDRMGIGAVFRQIPHRIPTFEELGLPETLRGLAQLSKGLVLVTGPTGSGKSTTLAAMLDLVNRSRRDHVITIEDPIEFVHPSKGCMINQREVGVHTRSFKSALRAALREDPDVVLVGEMRDLETISIAIETAETGHLVFGTLHTTTAPSTVERLVDQFPGDRQGQIRMMLADSLRAVIAQSLLRKIGGGRVAAFEILVGTPGVSNLIREGKTFQIASAMQTGKKQGMRLLNDSLLGLVQKGIVTPEEAWAKAADKDGLLGRFRSADVRWEPAGAAGGEG